MVSSIRPGRVRPGCALSKRAPPGAQWPPGGRWRGEYPRAPSTTGWGTRRIHWRRQRLASQSAFTTFIGAIHRCAHGLALRASPWRHVVGLACVICLRDCLDGGALVHHPWPCPLILPPPCLNRMLTCATPRCNLVGRSCVRPTAIYYHQQGDARRILHVHVHTPSPGRWGAFRWRVPCRTPAVSAVSRAAGRAGAASGLERLRARGAAAGRTAGTTAGGAAGAAAGAVSGLASRRARLAVAPPLVAGDVAAALAPTSRGPAAFLHLGRWSSGMNAGGGSATTSAVAARRPSTTAQSVVLRRCVAPGTAS